MRPIEIVEGDRLGHGIGAKAGFEEDLATSRPVLFILKADQHGDEAPIGKDEKALFIPAARIDRHRVERELPG